MVEAKELLVSLVREYQITRPIANKVRVDAAEEAATGEEMMLDGNSFRNDNGQYDAFQVPVGVDRSAVFMAIEHYIFVDILGAESLSVSTIDLYPSLYVSCSDGSLAYSDN
jgi:hypothetical protein